MYALTDYLRPRPDRISKVTKLTLVIDKISAYKNLKSSRAHRTKNQHSEPTYHIAERTPIANALNPYTAASYIITLHIYHEGAILSYPTMMFMGLYASD